MREGGKKRRKGKKLSMDDKKEGEGKEGGEAGKEGGQERGNREGEMGVPTVEGFEAELALDVEVLRRVFMDRIISSIRGKDLERGKAGGEKGGKQGRREGREGREGWGNG
jgi:hypothetical protein